MNPTSSGKMSQEDELQPISSFPDGKEDQKDIMFARILSLTAAVLYGTNFTMVKVMDKAVPVGASTSLRFFIAALAMAPWLIAPPNQSRTGDTSDAIIGNTNAVNENDENEMNLLLEEVGEANKEFMEDINVVNGVDENGMKSLHSAPITGSNQSQVNGTTDANIDIAGSINDNEIEWNEIKRLLWVILAGFEVGIWSSFAFISQAIGLKTIDASKSAFICSLSVLFVPILDVFTGKMISLRQAIGTIMAVAGVGFLELGGTGAFSKTATSLSTGDIVSLIQPVGFGISFWRLEKVMHCYLTEAKHITAAGLFAVALVSFLYCAFGWGGVPPPTLDQIYIWLTDPVILGELIWTGLVTTALTTFLEAFALKTISAAETILITTTEPLWGIAFAAMVLGEQFSLNDAFGAVLIFGGCLLSILNFGKEKESDAIEQQDTLTNRCFYLETESMTPLRMMDITFSGVFV